MTSENLNSSGGGGNLVHSLSGAHIRIAVRGTQRIQKLRLLRDDRLIIDRRGGGAKPEEDHRYDANEFKLRGGLYKLKSCRVNTLLDEPGARQKRQKALAVR